MDPRQIAEQLKARNGGCMISGIGTTCDAEGRPFDRWCLTCTAMAAAEAALLALQTDPKEPETPLPWDHTDVESDWPPQTDPKE